MKTRMLKMARRLWAAPEVPEHLARHNMRAWTRSIKVLGDRWLLAKHMPRETPLTQK